MLNDKYGNPIFQEQELFELLYQGQLDNLDKLIIGKTTETENISNLKFADNISCTIEEFDKTCQQNWQMPKEYKELDIKEHILSLCPPWDPDYSRVIDELVEFENRNMIDLLRWLKYFVDSCRKENIIWGVGRGSSVSSYVLFLIGVHKINSLEYNLDYKEFFR